MDISDCPSEIGKGIIFNGQAGSGKTTKLCEKVKQAKNPLVLSLMNKAIENVKSRLIDKEDKNKMFHIRLILL